MTSTIDLIKRLGIHEINNRFIVETPVSGGMGARSFKGIDIISGDAVFIKFLLFPSSKYEIAKFENEIEITKLLTKNTMGGDGCICAEYIYSEVLFDGDAYCLITKWLSLPTLEDWLSKNPELTFEDRLEIIHRVISAVTKIFPGIHHRDLHPGNILIEDVAVDWHKRISDAGIRIIDWGESLPEIMLGREGAPEYADLLINNAQKKIEGSFYSLPPEVFTPWENRRHQYGKYDAWAIAFLMHKILTNKDVIEHKDLGSYIHTIKTGEMGNILRRANRNILDLEHPASLLLSCVFEKITTIDPGDRQSLSYVGRVIWDIRIEGFIPKDIHEKYSYLNDPFNFTPPGGWKYCVVDELD